VPVLKTRGQGKIRKAQPNKATAAKLGKNHQGMIGQESTGSIRNLKANKATAANSTVLFAPSQSLQLADPHSEDALKPL
jgi:hypothetical protein